MTQHVLYGLNNLTNIAVFVIPIFQVIKSINIHVTPTHTEIIIRYIAVVVKIINCPPKIYKEVLEGKKIFCFDQEQRRFLLILMTFSNNVFCRFAPFVIFDQKQGEAFCNIWGLPLRVQGKLKKSK